MYIHRPAGRSGEPITVTLNGPTLRRIRALHAYSQEGTPQGGGRTSLEKYVEEIVESFLADRRSGIPRLDPDRYTERNGSDADHAIV